MKIRSNRTENATDVHQWDRCKGCFQIQCIVGRAFDEEQMCDNSGSGSNAGGLGSMPTDAHAKFFAKNEATPE